MIMVTGDIPFISSTVKPVIVGHHKKKKKKKKKALGRTQLSALCIEYREMV